MFKLAIMLIAFLFISLPAEDYVKISKVNEDRVAGTSMVPSLAVYMDFYKEGLVAASKYKFHIKSASDSTGKELKLIKSWNADIDGFNIINAGEFGGRDERNPDLLKLRLRLEPTQRAATTFNAEGFLTVKITDEEAIYVKNVLTLANKKIASQALKNAGVSIVIGGPVLAGEDSVLQGTREGVSIAISGEKAAIGEISLLDKNGKKLMIGSGLTSTHNGVLYKKISAYDGMEDDAMLKIMVLSKTKERKIPFKFVNHPLP